MRELTRLWLEKTQGLIEATEGEALAKIARYVPRHQAIVEIGSHTGLSTCWMAAGSRDGNGAHVYAIDPWPEPRPGSKDDPWDLGAEGVFQRFNDNIRGITQDVFNEDYRDTVTALRTTSRTASMIWTHEIGLLFIDAIHEGWAVRQDWRLWEPHLAADAWVCFHDFGDSYPGVRKVIAEEVVPSRSWQAIEFVDPSLWCGKL